MLGTKEPVEIFLSAGSLNSLLLLIKARACQGAHQVMDILAKQLEIMAVRNNAVKFSEGPYPVD